MECGDIQRAIASGITEHWRCDPLDAGALHVVTTSLLPNDDCVELVIEDRGETVVVSDTALVYTFLSSYGINLYVSRHKRYLQYVHQIADRYHAEFERGELRKVVARDELWPGVNLMVEAIQRTCAIVDRLRASSTNNFKEQVYALFASRRTRAAMDFPVTGFAQTHSFDVRLNGSSEVLARTISATRTSVVQEHVERSIYAFEDVRRAGRSFSPVVVYDDTAPERGSAWNDDHFSILQRYEISLLAFRRNRDELERIAQEHQI